MTKDELVAVMREAWASAPGAGLSPLTDGSEARTMVDAQLGGIAEGILAGGTPTPVPSPTWNEDEWIGGETGTQFELSYTPIEGSVDVFLNGWRVRNWTISGKVVTLPRAKLSGQELVIKYQFLGG